ncbi:MAG TPA: signal peptidase II [Acidimicrobiales bacterium]|nr:signal peptidase II [Acidimicrobiales bacterium]
MKARAPQLAGVAGVAAVAIVLDQLSKSWALSALDDHSIDLVLGARFALTFNSGAAFSIGSGRPALFAAVAVLTVVALSVFVARSPLNRARTVAFGLIIGGALGNVVDRVFRDHGGKVVDFIDLGWWPVFNVADSWLFIGVVVMLVDAWREDRA